METKTKKKQDFNSSENQEIKGKFVGRDVLACISYETDTVLKAEGEDLPTFEDIENFYEYKCPECGAGQQEPFDSEAQSEEFDTDYKYKCYECDKEFDTEPESEPQEIYEWWIVTEFLHNDLKKRGEAVLQWGNNYYWGRCCTGQAILLDHVISEICSDMEILDGQPNAWNKK